MRFDQQYLKLNKNLALSFILSALVSALAAQIFADQETHLNSTYTMMVGYGAFFLIFSILFYIDNSTKLNSFKNNRIILKRKLITLIASFGIGEIFYIVIRWSTQFYFLNVNFEPYLASFTSEAISSGCYMLIVTLSAKILGLFKIKQIPSSS